MVSVYLVSNNVVAAASFSFRPMGAARRRPIRLPRLRSRVVAADVAKQRGETVRTRTSGSPDDIRTLINSGLDQVW